MADRGRFSQKDQGERRPFKKAFVEKEVFAGEKNEPAENVIAGRNAVTELLKSGRTVDKIYVQKGEREGSLPLIVAMATEKTIPVVEVQKQKLDQLAGSVRHQGVVALAAQKEYSSLSDILKIAGERGEAPFLVLCDGIDDPGNLGALIRCAEGAGAHGVVITKRRSVGLTAVVSKASAGALEHMAVAKVSNIANTIHALKEKGVWIFAAEAGGTPYYETNFKGPCALIFGSEGNGVSQIVIDNCDVLTSIPMYGKVNSFNVSTAASVILCEAARQNRAK
jgi:23S rRNA (guanosine2251-2'-O)-methyltransferase